MFCKNWLTSLNLNFINFAIIKMLILMKTSFLQRNLIRGNNSIWMF